MADLFVQGSDTSQAAAVSMRGSARIIREQICDTISTMDGCTCDEVELLLDLRHQTASARITELRDEGLIEDSGNRRKTRSGRDAAVWVSVN